MFGIGMQELLIILVVALIVVGPKKLPELGKNLGKALGQFRKATEDLKENLSENEAYRDLQDIKRNFHDTVDNLRPRACWTPPSEPRRAGGERPDGQAGRRHGRTRRRRCGTGRRPTGANQRRPAPARQASASPMAAARRPLAAKNTMPEEAPDKTGSDQEELATRPALPGAPGGAAFPSHPFAVGGAGGFLAPTLQEEPLRAPGPAPQGGHAKDAKLIYTARRGLLHLHQDRGPGRAVPASR